MSLSVDVPYVTELHNLVDNRTLDILDRRRRSAFVIRRGWLVRRALLLADVAGLTFAYLVAEVTFGHNPAAGDRFGSTAELGVFLVTLPLWIVTAKLYGLYDRDEERTDHSTVDDVVGVFHLVTIGAWLLFAGASLTGVADPDLLRLITFWTTAVVSIPIARVLARSICRRHIAYLQNTVIVGAGEVGQLVAKKLLQHPEYGINLVGFIDAEPRERRTDLQHLTILGAPERLPSIVQLLDVERVIVAFSTESHAETLELIRTLSDLHVQIDIVPRLFDVVGPGVDLHSVEGLPLLGLRPPRLSRSSLLLKRTMDIAIALGALVVVAPLFALAAVAVKLDSPGPVFFRQLRVGADNRLFRIWKFRTMSNRADERKAEVAHLNMHVAEGGDPRMFKIPNDPRVTRAGRVLRRFSLDELPQLLNVLSGEMSLVGPRPLIVEEDQHVGSWARRRLDLKPGVTGLWQVLGRSAIPFEEMVKLDYLYVTTWSPLQDIKLMLRTIPALFSARTAY